MNKLKIDRELFVSKLNKAIKFIPKNSIIPAWENFMLRMREDTMFITASDGVMQVTLSCKVESSGDFTICVPAALMLKNVSYFTENEIKITQKKDNKIELKCGKATYNIGLDCTPEGYGSIRMGEITSEITLHQMLLGKVLDNVKEFVNEDHPNDSFRVINISEIDNKIVISGLTNILMTRAALRPISINSWSPINIHVDTAKKVSGMLGDTGEVSVVHSGGGNCIRFFTNIESPDYFDIISTVSNAKFPNTEKLFSLLPDTHLTINTLELMGAIKRLALYYPKGLDPKVRISNALNPQELHLFSEDANTDRDGTEIVSVNNPAGLVIEKTYDSKSAIKLLSAIDTGEVELHFIPGAVRSPEGNSFIVPRVSTQEENIYSFLLATIS